MAPFFIHENYARPRSRHSNGDSLKQLKCIANSADSICMGDGVNTAISMQNWSLLPTQVHISGYANLSFPPYNMYVILSLCRSSLSVYLSLSLSLSLSLHLQVTMMPVLGAVFRHHAILLHARLIQHHGAIPPNTGPDKQEEQVGNK